MNSILFAISAGSVAATSNFFFRKSTEESTTSPNSTGYLLLYYLSAFVASLLCFPDVWKNGINFTILGFGACAGALSVSLMTLTSRALINGPAGLTFAFQNASALFPGFILFIVFGAAFNFSFSFLQGIGILLVLLGLFLGTRTRKTKDASAEKEGRGPSLKWLQYTLALFAVQVLALTVIQGRCVLFNCGPIEGFFSFLSATQEEDIWFMPGMFGAASIIQSLLFFQEKRKIEFSEVKWGVLGGLTNFGSTFLLLLSTKYALDYEKPILFPCFAVTTILLCCGWASKLYGEKFNVTSNLLCASGIILGTLG